MAGRGGGVTTHLVCEYDTYMFSIHDDATIDRQYGILHTIECNAIHIYIYTYILYI